MEAGRGKGPKQRALRPPFAVGGCYFQLRSGMPPLLSSAAGKVYECGLALP